MPADTPPPADPDHALDALRQAHQQRQPPPPPSADWQARLMADVHAIGPLAADPSPVPVLRIVWRAAAAAAAVAVLLAGFAVSQSATDFSDVAMSLVMNNAGSLVLQGSAF